MTTSKNIVLLLILALAATGCVSTTTGTALPEADKNDAAEYNYQLGARYFQAGSYELARDRLQRAIDLDPKMAIAYSTLALTYEKLGNMRLATESHERAVRVAPRNFEVLNNYAVFLCNTKDFDGARKYFERAASHPENDDAEVTLTNAGLCMMQKPDAEVAEKFFRDALERKSTYGEALLQLALLKYQQRDYLHARGFLQRYMSTNRSTAGVLYFAAEIEGKLGNYREREEYVDRLIREFPKSPEARKALSGT